MARHQEEIAKWREGGGVDPDPRLFADEILPRLTAIPVRPIMEVTGLSEAYCYRIRRGEITPHPRH